MAKVMVSIPDDLLKQVDREARKRKLSRSAFLQRAAADELARPSHAEVVAAMARSRARFASEPPFDAAAAVRRARDTPWQ